MDTLRSFFGRLCHPTVPRLAAVTLGVLFAVAGSSLAFCDEIHDAARDGDVTKVNALLNDNPFLVFSKDGTGETPLHWAIERGHKDVAELLLARKAEINAKDGFGGTPLHTAAARGYMDLAALLLANKADVNAETNHWDTPLHVAELNGHKEMVEFLRRHGGHE